MFGTVSHFHHSLVFADKAWNLPERNPYKTKLKWLALSLVLKYWTRVEVSDIGKHSSLLQYGNNYVVKRFMVQYTTLIYMCNLILKLKT